MGRTKNEYVKEIMGVKGKPDIIDSIERKRLQWYSHIKRMPEERIIKLIMEWIPGGEGTEDVREKSRRKEYKQPWQQEI